MTDKCYYVIHLTEIEPAQVTVRDLKLDDFTFSPQTGVWSLNVTWKKPAFNYSIISAYLISYQVNEGNVVTNSTVKYLLLPSVNPY